MLKKIKGLFGGEKPADDPDLFPFDSPEFYDDPYPFYNRLRAENGLYRSPSGAWVVSKYADNLEALKHEHLGNSPSRFSTFHESKRERFVCADVANNIMPFLDGPKHTEQRKLMAKIFQMEVKAIREKLDDIAEQHVANLQGEIEVIQELGTPFAMQVICDILGIPNEPKLRKWSNFFFYLFTQIPSMEVRDQVDQSLTEFRNWLDEELNSAERGILGQLKEAVDAGNLGKPEAIDSMILFFADGLENVDSGIGNLLFVFANHPEQWNLLRDDPSLIKSAVDECLRFESPAQYVGRTCLADFEWKGAQLKKDSSVILLLGSANRDEEVFANSENFDITRSPNKHLSFGQGRHSCLGGNLVELEFAALLKAFTRHFRTIKQSSAIQWQARKGHRWMESGNFVIT